jgi:hypothetical protein
MRKVHMKNVAKRRNMEDVMQPTKLELRFSRKNWLSSRK